MKLQLLLVHNWDTQDVDWTRHVVCFQLQCTSKLPLVHRIFGGCRVRCQIAAIQSAVESECSSPLPFITRVFIWKAFGIVALTPAGTCTCSAGGGRGSCSHRTGHSERPHTQGSARAALPAGQGRRGEVQTHAHSCHPVKQCAWAVCLLRRLCASQADACVRTCRMRCPQVPPP